MLAAQGWCPFFCFFFNLSLSAVCLIYLFFNDEAAARSTYLGTNFIRPRSDLPCNIKAQPKVN